MLRKLLGGLTLVLLSGIAHSASLVVLPRQLVVDSGGSPRSGAKLYTYACGTTTPLTTYTTSALSTANANPVVSVSTGLFPAVYVGADISCVKLVLKDSSDVSIWSEDNIPVSQLGADQTQAEEDAGVTPKSPEYPPGNILRYIDSDEHADILAGSSTYDASSDAQDWLDSLEEGAVACLVGTVRAQGLRLKKNNIDFECGGWLKPVSNSSSATILTIGDDSDDTQVRRIRGHLRIGSENESYSAWSNITGLKIERASELDIGLDVVGLGVGFLCAPGEGVAAYNQFRLGLIGQNKVGVKVAPTSTGFCNDLTFYGGRFRTNSGSYTSGVVSIDIQNGGSNQPNNIRFYSPTFEGPGQVLSNDGSRVRVMDARWEGSYSGTAGTDYPEELISLQDDDQESLYDFSFNADILGSGYSVDHGAGTRVDDLTFTIASKDVTPYFYPGAVIDVTVSAVEHRVMVTASSFSTDTTVRVSRPVISGNPTAVETPRITVDAPNDPKILRFANLDIVGTSDMTSNTVVRQRQFYVASPFTIRGINDTYPTMQFLPGNSAADRAISINDLTAQTAYITHQGRAWLSRLAIGSQTTPAATQSAITAPTGGGTQDAECRTAVNSIITALETFGLVTPN